MANSLLFTLWPNGDEIIFGPRWTAYVNLIVCLLSNLLCMSQGLCPTFALLRSQNHVAPRLYCEQHTYQGVVPVSGLNSHHPPFLILNDDSQNCTVWEGGSIGSGNLNGFQLIAYVASTDTPVDDPSNVASNFTEHNDFDFFGLDLSTVHSSSYSSYIGGGSTSSTLAPTSTIQTSTSVTATSSAAGATQTKVMYYLILSSSETESRAYSMVNAVARDGQDLLYVHLVQPAQPYQRHIIVNAYDQIR